MSLNVEQAKEILAERYEFFTSNINAGNISEAIKGYYTESSYATGNESPLTEGIEGITGMFQGMMSELKDMRIDMVDTRVAGDDCIYSLVTSTVTVIEANEDMTIKSLLVFRKQDGTWLCDADIWAMGGFE